MHCGDYDDVVVVMYDICELIVHESKKKNRGKKKKKNKDKISFGHTHTHTHLHSNTHTRIAIYLDKRFLISDNCMYIYI